jgi:hypothetical protein
MFRTIGSTLGAYKNYNVRGIGLYVLERVQRHLLNLLAGQRQTLAQDDRSGRLTMSQQFLRDL